MLELIADNHSTTRNRVYIAFDGIEDEWAVQKGTNLYIRGAWLSWKDEEKAFIDIPIWYEHKQAGSNLYIRSAWHSYSDEEEAFIDNDVIWYKPKQNGNDLYITSVSSFWNDEDQGNIDTDYYLEPIQEGSNLYIRQDFMEGDDE